MTAIRRVTAVCLPLPLVLLGWFLSIQIASAQEHQAEAEEQAPQPPRPIPAAEIPGRSELANQELRTIREQLSVSPVTATIDSLLPEYLANIRRQEKSIDALQLAPQTLRALNDRQEEWDQYASQLSEWRQKIEERATQLDDIRLRLQQMRAEWEVTRSTSAQEELPGALQHSIESVLGAITNIEPLLQERRSKVLALLDRVSVASVQVNEHLESITGTLSSFAGMLLEQDNPPLWKLFGKREEESKAEGFLAVNQRRLERLEEYISDHKMTLVILLAEGAFLFSLLYVLRRKSTALLASGPPGQARPVPLVLQRPISTALVAIYILASVTIPRAPAVFSRTAALIVLLPLLRLLPLYFPLFFRQVFYVLSGLYLFHRTEALTIDFPVPYRLMLLALTASAIGAAVWFEQSLIRHGKATSIDRRRWHIAVSRGAIILLSISLIANILGAVALSELLTDGTLNSVYSVMALTAGVMVFGDLFDLLLRTRVAQSLRMVREAQDVLSKQWAKFLRLAAILGWVLLTLSNFDLWIPVRTILTEFLGREWTIGTWTFTIGSVLGLILTLWISVLLSRLVRFALKSDVLPRTTITRGLQSTISTMAYYLILLAGLVLATSMIGIRWDTFAIVIGALGVGIGFGLQNLVNNFVSGLILLFERPINVGDTIEFGSRFGDVLRIGLRASTVRTFDGSEVIVPNSSLVSSEVVNWTLSDRNRRMEIPVGVAYGSDPQQVLDLLLAVVRSHPLVMKVPEPFAWFMGFGDSSLDFVVKFWSQFEHSFTARSEIMTAINNSLTEAGITIPFPQRDLHVRSVDPGLRDSLFPGGDAST